MCFCRIARQADKLFCVTDQVNRIVENREEVGGQREWEEEAARSPRTPRECFHACEMDLCSAVPLDS